MYCCLYRDTDSQGNIIYGILDTKDEVVEELNHSAVLSLLKCNCFIAGLELSGNDVAYWGMIFEKFKPDTIFTESDFTVVTGIHNEDNRWYSGFILLYRDGSHRIKYIDGFKAYEYIYSNCHMPLQYYPDVLHITFEYMDKHYYGEDREEYFCKCTEINLKTGEVKRDKDWHKMR